MPSFRTFYEALAQRFTVVRYSTRNARLSDQNVEDLEYAALMTGYEALLIVTAILYRLAFLAARRRTAFGGEGHGL